MNYEDIKQIIESNIKDNDKGEITAEVLRDVLMNVVGVLSDGYIFGGVVTPSDTPRYSDAKMFFIAREPGRYTNFGDLEISSLGVITLDEDWTWSWVSLFPKYANKPGNSEDIGISQKAFTTYIEMFVKDVAVLDDNLLFIGVNNDILTSIPINLLFDANNYYNKEVSDNRFVRIGDVDEPTKDRDAANKLYVDNVAADVIEVKQKDLYSLMTEGLLVAGKSYRITDYAGIFRSDEYDKDSERNGNYRLFSASNKFDIVVKALSPNTISSDASALHHDGYFINNDLSKWVLRVKFADEGIRFGVAKLIVVYYMRDEFGNEAPYDFKNLKFNDGSNLSYFTFSSIGDDGTTVSDASLGYLDDSNNLISDCNNNSIAPQIIDGNYYANANIFIMDSLLPTCNDNKIGSDCYMNAIYGGSSRNTIEDGCDKNILQGSNADNVIGSKSKSNTLGQGCERNTFGQGCEGNTLGVNCVGNVFGNTCRDNFLANNSSYNTFGNANIEISLSGLNCSFNIFENYIYDVKLNLRDIQFCKFQSHCEAIYISAPCNHVCFGLNCHHINVTGAGLYFTNFGNGCCEMDIATRNMVHYVIAPGTKGVLKDVYNDGVYPLIAGNRNDGTIVSFNPFEKGITATIDDEDIYVVQRGQTWREIAAYTTDVKESTTYQDEKTIMTYKGRLLLLDGEYVYANDIAKPASYITKEHPLGTWIEATDGSLISSENWNTEGAGKTAQSVVLITADHQFRIGLQNAYSSTCAWGGYGTDISGITNKTAWSSAVKDFNAKENTDAIIAALNPNWKGEALTNGLTSGLIDSSTVVYNGTSATTKGAPAAEACRLYSSGNITAGKWDLPAFGHLHLMYLNKAAINACLTACGGTKFSEGSYTWSSTEYYSYYAWVLFFANGSQTYYTKFNSYYVRAVSAF